MCRWPLCVPVGLRILFGVQCISEKKGGGMDVKLPEVQRKLLQFMREENREVLLWEIRDKFPRTAVSRIHAALHWLLQEKFISSRSHGEVSDNECFHPTVWLYKAFSLAELKARERAEINESFAALEKEVADARF